MKFYLYDKESGVYQGYKNAVVDKAKTIALKKTVLKYPQPNFSTTIAPTGKIGKCWFKNGAWTNVNPNKPKPVVPKIVENIKKASTKKIDADKTENKK